MKKYIFDRNEFKWSEEFYDLIQKDKNTYKIQYKISDLSFDLKEKLLSLIKDEFFIDDDGKAYLFVSKDQVAGESSVYGVELEDDMITVKHKPRQLLPDKTKGTSFEGHAFFEASSMRKIDNKYYFVY